MTAGFDWHNQLWLLSPEGIFIVQSNGTMRKLMPQPFEGLMRFFFVDREGSIWLPTRQGLYQLVHAEFTSWQVDPEGRSNTTYKASEDGQGRIWVSGQRNTFFLEPDESTFRPVPGISLHSINVRGISSGCYVKGGSDHLWFATPDEVKALPDAEGDLIYATRDGVLWTGNPQGLVRRPTPDSEPELTPFISGSGDGVMAEDSKGRRFLTVRGQGVFQLDGVPEPRLITPSDSPTPKRPNSIMADPDDNIWFVSRGPNGLGYWNPLDDQWHFATWIQLNIPFPIPINLSLNADREGGFWVVTTSGVLHCDRKELMEAIPESRPVKWRLLQKSDGLPTIAASFHNQGSLLDSRGRIWIPTDSGIAMTDPARWKNVRDRIPPPPVIFTGMRLDNKDADLSPDNTLTISPGGHLLELDYKALHYADPDRVSYRYRLLGFEDEWSHAGSTDNVRYQRLPHGTYQFEVTADNGFGDWSERAATLTIIVQPQWWERTSIRFGIALVLLATGVFAYHLRIRSLQKARSRQEELSRKLIETQETERQRLARELHDGLGQNLLVIKNGLSLEATRNKEHDSANEAFNRYANAAKDCLSEVRQMSQDLRPHQIDRLGLKVALESVADRLSETSHVPIHHEVDELDTVFPPEDEIHLLRIIQESLGNAIRHSDASEVKLRVQNQPDAVHLTVSDDGKGFHVEETRVRPRSEGGLGLISIEERARMLGGTCRFTSAPGEGTVVDVHIPITKNIS